MVDPGFLSNPLINFYTSSIGLRSLPGAENAGVKNAGVENAGAITRRIPSEEIP